MSVFVSHPTGNTFVRAAVDALQQCGSLAEFHTAVAVFPGSSLDRLGQIGAFGELHRRKFKESLKSYTHTAPWREMARVVAGKAKLGKLTRHETGLFSVDAVYRGLDARVARNLRKGGRSKPSALYAYEDGASVSFAVAKELGIACFYDLPIGYWRAARRLLSIELERWPEWAVTIKGFADSEAKVARKDEELRLADRIFVASSFTKKTLEDYPGKLAPIKVIPYGFPGVGGRLAVSGGPLANGDSQQPTAYSQLQRDSQPPTANRKLKLLFVGGLSQRKGIADMFAAVEGLGRHVELTVVGRKASDQCPALDAALAKHRWIPSLPHEKILEQMRGHDVLLFPSLFEGFGLVITEAMSQGTPVITTDRTAGPDLIDHGLNGWLIEAGNTAALQAQIEVLLAHPERIAEAGREAMATARRRPWEVYGRELAEAMGR